MNPEPMSLETEENKNKEMPALSTWTVNSGSDSFSTSLKFKVVQHYANTHWEAFI